MNMKHLKKAVAVSLAALATAGMIAGCGGEKKASAPSSQPAAQTVKINFPDGRRVRRPVCGGGGNHQYVEQ